MSLKLEYYGGVVLNDPDPKNMGRYKVHIPELQLRMSENSGIWCRNKIHTYRATNSDDGVYGTYYPLHSGTKVIVSITNEDYSSASIERINIHEKDLDHRDTLPFNITDASRDDLYMVLRTPKYDSVIVVTEDTSASDEPPNTLFIYHHNGESKIVMDSNGMHINTIHDFESSVGGNSSVVVNGNAGVKVGGDCGVTVGGNMSANVSGDAGVKTGGNCDIDAGAIVNIKGGSAVNIDAAALNLNSGAASPGAIPGYNSSPVAAKELNLRKADKRI